MGRVASSPEDMVPPDLNGLVPNSEATGGATYEPSQTMTIDDLVSKVARLEMAVTALLEQRATMRDLGTLKMELDLTRQENARLRQLVLKQEDNGGDSGGSGDLLQSSNSLPEEGEDNKDGLEDSSPGSPYRIPNRYFITVEGEDIRNQTFDQGTAGLESSSAMETALSRFKDSSDQNLSSKRASSGCDTGVDSTDPTSMLKAGPKITALLFPPADNPEVKREKGIDSPPHIRSTEQQITDGLLAQPLSTLRLPPAAPPPSLTQAIAKSTSAIPAKTGLPISERPQSVRIRSPSDASLDSPSIRQRSPTTESAGE